MRKLGLKLSVLALVLVAALAMAPMASANTVTFNLTNNNLGIAGSLGTVTMTDNTTGGVDVTVTLSSQYGVFMNNQKGKGGDLFIDTTATLTQSSLTNLSIGSVTGFKSGGTLAGFSYTFDWNLAGGTSPSTLTFTLTGVSTSQISAFGFHFICLGVTTCPGSNSNTGFVLTGPPVTGGGPPPVPEPGTLGLLGTGLVGIAGLVRRRMMS